MLVVFNLGWERFDIDSKVSLGNQRLNGVAAEKKAGHFIIFNLASLGAGERIIDRKERRENARKKDPDFDRKIAAMRLVPKEKDRPMEEGAPDQKTVDFLRHYHAQIAKPLHRDENFKAYRDAAEMLARLKARGHDLAVAFTGASKEVEQKLKLARTLDYFGDKVYGHDSLEMDKHDLTSCAVYRHAMWKSRAEPNESIIVSDSADGICEGKAVKPLALIGYVDPYLAEDAIDVRIREMREAGAHFAVVGGNYVSTIPDFILSNRGLRDFRESDDRRHKPWAEYGP